MTHTGSSSALAPVFELAVEVFADLDVLEHTCQLIYILSRHANILIKTND